MWRFRKLAARTGRRPPLSTNAGFRPYSLVVTCLPVIERNSLRSSAKSIACLVVVVGLFAVVGCNHTDRYTREMTWSSDANTVGLQRLPAGAIQLTFVESPILHVGLQIPGLKERLEKYRETDSAGAVRDPVQAPSI